MNSASILAIFGMSAAATSALNSMLPNQFDLVCRGTETWVRGGRVVSKPWSGHFVIDLNRKVICFAPGCAGVAAIPRIEPLTLTLAEGSERGEPGWSHRATVDRTTGVYEEVGTAGLSKLDISGHCTVSQFSGLPEPKF